MEAVVAALQEVGGEMTELQAHLSETQELHSAMQDVVDVFGRLHGALAVQRACMAPASVFRAPLQEVTSNSSPAKAAAAASGNAAVKGKAKGRPKMTLRDALKGGMPAKMQNPNAMDHLVGIMKLAKERRDTAKAGGGTDPGFSLRDVHSATGKPMMACNAYMSALVAGKFVERRSDTGRKGAGITFHWLPPRARAGRR